MWLRIDLTEKLSNPRLRLLDKQGEHVIQQIYNPTLGGTYTFFVPRAVVRPESVVYFEVDEFTLPIPLEAIRTRPLQLVIVPFNDTRLSAQDVLDIHDALYNMFPFSEVHVTLHSTIIVPVSCDFDGFYSANGLMDQLARRRDNYDRKVIYYGAISQTPYCMGGYADEAAGNSVGGWYSRYKYISVRTLQHEIAHQFGVLHAPCDTPDPDAEYPYPGGVTGVPGIDMATNTVYPATSSEIMGYCNYDWISDYSYRTVLSRIVE
jgi:hypothetical protein